MRLQFLLIAGLILVQTPTRESAGSDCTAGACHQGVKKFALLHQPVAAGDCLACHLQRTPAHPQAGGKNFDLVAEGGNLCYRCHSPLGEKKTVHLPVRTGECLSCHQPHGASGRFLLNGGEDRSALCFGCHDKASFGEPFVHGPVAAGACSRCHSPHQADRPFLLLKEPREACLDCHEDFSGAMAGAKFIHSPVRKEPCTSCHHPHASPTPFLLKKKMPDLCLSCHSGVAKRLQADRVRHAPMHQETSCGNCHSTHYSEGRNLLVTDEPALCFGCHGSSRKESRLKNIEKELKGKKNLHGPLRQGKCSACHQPHGSDNFRLLTGRYPAALYARYEEGVYEFCLGCHQQHLLQFRDTTIYTEFRNGDLNLHYLHSVGPKGRSCRFCHEPHASEEEKLAIKDGFPFGSWKGPIRLERTATGGSCAPGCHRPLQYDRETPVAYPGHQAPQ